MRGISARVDTPILMCLHAPRIAAHAASDAGKVRFWDTIDRFNRCTVNSIRVGSSPKVRYVTARNGRGINVARTVRLKNTYMVVVCVLTEVDLRCEAWIGEERCRNGVRDGDGIRFRFCQELRTFSSHQKPVF